MKGIAEVSGKPWDLEACFQLCARCGNLFPQLIRFLPALFKPGLVLLLGQSK
jgi:hypothetical protein